MTDQRTLHHGRGAQRRAGLGPATPARRPAAIDPRIRARRAEVLRSQARRRLRVALGLSALVVVLAGCWLLLHSKLLSARVIEVVGSVHTPVSEIVAAGGLADHPPLVDVSGSAAAGIERLAWVEHATVAREWPDGVRVVVVERTPVAAVQDGSGWVLVARSGWVLAHVDAPPASLLRVTGAEGPSTPGTTMRSVRPALAVVSTLPRAFKGQVGTVQAEPGGDVSLHLTSGLTVNLGSTSSLRQKYEDVAAILAGAKLASGEVIDVAAPATPVVAH